MSLLFTVRAGMTARILVRADLLCLFRVFLLLRCTEQRIGDFGHLCESRVREVAD
jgi:hypothetical protein